MFAIGGCQHYDRVSSRNNWRRHFPWWVWSSQTGKDAVSLCTFKAYGLSGSLPRQTLIEGWGKPLCRLWGCGDAYSPRTSSPDFRLPPDTGFPCPSCWWRQTNSVKFRGQSFWELLTPWVSGRLESLPKAPCTLTSGSNSQTREPWTKDWVWKGQTTAGAFRALRRQPSHQHLLLIVTNTPTAVSHPIHGKKNEAQAVGAQFRCRSTFARIPLLEPHIAKHWQTLTWYWYAAHRTFINHLVTTVRLNNSCLRAYMCQPAYLFYEQ